MYVVELSFRYNFIAFCRCVKKKKSAVINDFFAHHIVVYCCSSITLKNTNKTQ